MWWWTVISHENHLLAKYFHQYEIPKFWLFGADAIARQLPLWPTIPSNLKFSAKTSFSGESLLSRKIPDFCWCYAWLSSFTFRKKLVTPVLEFHQLQKKSNQPAVEIAFITFVGRSKWCQIKFCIIIFPEALGPHERNSLKNCVKPSKLQLIIIYW